MRLEGEKKIVIYEVAVMLLLLCTVYSLSSIIIQIQNVRET